MVFRSVISGLVFSIPLADKVIPSAISKRLKVDNKKTVLLLPPTAMREKVRDKNHDPQKRLSQDEYIFSSIYQQPNKKTVYYPSDYDGAAAVPSSASLKESESPYLHLPATAPLQPPLGESPNSSVSQFASPLSTSPSTPKLTQPPTMNKERYLNDQNNKFDDLINRNIDVVLDDDDSISGRRRRRPPSSLQGSIVDLLDIRDTSVLHKVQDISSIVSYAASGLSPWKPKPPPKPFSRTSGKGSVSSGSSVGSSSPASAGSSVGSGAGSPLRFKGTGAPSAGSNAGGLDPAFDLQLQPFGINDSLEDLIQDLDYNKKLQLYKILQEELEGFEDANEILSANLDVKLATKQQQRKQQQSYDIDVAQLQESGITLDKIQALTIILIRLIFAAIKFSIPVAVHLYNKFTANEFYMVNNKNFNNILGYQIKLLKLVEKRLNGDSLQGYQFGNQSKSTSPSTSPLLSKSNDSYDVDGIKEYQDGDFEMMYEQMTANASEYFTSQLGAATEGLQTDNSWKGIALGYVLNRYLSQQTSLPKPKKYNKNDPKYSVYYSRSDLSSTSLNGDFHDTRRYRRPDILRAAEQFASEL